jgi:hypothetical protein
MKRLVLVSLIGVLLGFSTLANAALVNNGDGLIYDTDLNITWYNFSYGGEAGTSWSGAKDWASTLTLGGTAAGSWRLPTTPGTGFGYLNEGEFGHLFYTELALAANTDMTVHQSPFTNILQYTYWTGTEQVTGSSAYVFEFTGYQYAYYDVSNLHAMAVHEGDVGASTVPIPAAFWLLGSGLLGLVGIRKKTIN